MSKAHFIPDACGNVNLLISCNELQPFKEERKAVSKLYSSDQYKGATAERESNRQSYLHTSIETLGQPIALPIFNIGRCSSDNTDHQLPGSLLFQHLPIDGFDGFSGCSNLAFIFISSPPYSVMIWLG